LIVPMAAIEAPELRLAAMLLWLEVLRSFTLVSDEAVVFSAVPSVVLISLASTNNVNPEIMAFFIIYLVLTTFLLAHRVNTGENIRKLKLVFRTVFLVSITALVIGSVVVIPIRLACTSVFNAAMPEFTRLRDRLTISGYADSNYLQIAQGPVRLSEETMMTVRSVDMKSGQHVPLYWRGKVFDTYTGHGWQSSSNYHHVYPINNQQNENGNYIYSGPQVPGKRLIRQDFHKSRRGMTREVFAAAEPVIIESAARTLSQNEFNCWHGIYGRSGKTRYTVVSVLPNDDPGALRKAPAKYSPDIQTRYLRKITSTAKVGELSRKITKGINNPYDKAMAIQRYLGQTCIYDLDAPPTPPGEDAVEHFLFNSRVGYCDVFASAMVIMCREVGIPARLATGYLTGVYDEQQDLYSVRDMDRHAWAELYFPGCGWITFDPTEYTSSQNQGWLEVTAKQIRRTISEIFGGPGIVPLAAALFIVGALFAFGSEIKEIIKSRQADSPSKMHNAALMQYLAIRKTLEATNPSLTPAEVAITAKRISEDAGKLAEEAVGLFGEIRYGQRDVNLEDIQRLKTLRREIKSSIKQSRRRSN